MAAVGTPRLFSADTWKERHKTLPHQELKSYVNNMEYNILSNKLTIRNVRHLQHPEDLLVL